MNFKETCYEGLDQPYLVEIWSICRLLWAVKERLGASEGGEFSEQCIEYPSFQE